MTRAGMKSARLRFFLVNFIPTLLIGFVWSGVTPYGFFDWESWAMGAAVVVGLGFARWEYE